MQTLEHIFSNSPQSIPCKGRLTESSSRETQKGMLDGWHCAEPQKQGFGVCYWALGWVGALTQPTPWTQGLMEENKAPLIPVNPPGVPQEEHCL